MQPEMLQAEKVSKEASPLLRNITWTPDDGWEILPIKINKDKSLYSFLSKP